MLLFFFFFFSSRRRHTRSLRDWSSDVCSSDLLDETRQSVRDLRDEVRQVLSSEGTAQEKAGRLLSTATAAVKSAREPGSREGAASAEEHLTVTSAGSEASAEAGGSTAGPSATESSGTSSGG